MEDRWQTFYSAGPLGQGKEYFLGNKKLQDVLQECNIFLVHWDNGAGSFGHWEVCLIWIEKRAGYEYLYAMDKNGNTFVLPISGGLLPEPDSDIAPLLRKMKRVKDLEVKEAKLLAKLAPIQKELKGLKKQIKK